MSVRIFKWWSLEKDAPEITFLGRQPGHQAIAKKKRNEGNKKTFKNININTTQQNKTRLNINNIVFHCGIPAVWYTSKPVYCGINTGIPRSIPVVYRRYTAGIPPVYRRYRLRYTAVSGVPHLSPLCERDFMNDMTLPTRTLFRAWYTTHLVSVYT